jgi:hypothetical protein
VDLKGGSACDRKIWKVYSSPFDLLLVLDFHLLPRRSRPMPFLYSGNTPLTYNAV